LQEAKTAVVNACQQWQGSGHKKYEDERERIKALGILDRMYGERVGVVPAIDMDDVSAEIVGCRMNWTFKACRKGWYAYDRYENEWCVYEDMGPQSFRIRPPETFPADSEEWFIWTRKDDAIEEAERLMAEECGRLEAIGILDEMYAAR
jgi:hypothetical protein